MSNTSIIPYYVEKDLPFAVSAQLAELPEEAQREFLIEYRRKAKNVVVAYVLHFLLPAHYIYLDKFVTQLLFWFTFGGFGIWWFIDLIRMPSLVGTRNKDIADECLRYVMHRYKIQQQNPNPNPRGGYIPAAPQPRQLNVPLYDPMRPSVESLKLSYLIDYNFKTWQVVGEIQYDWSNAGSEREFRLASGNEVVIFTLKREGMYLNCYVGNLVNILSIDQTIDTQINQYGNPPAQISQGDFTLFRDNRFDGLAFDKSTGATPTKVVVWDYYDNTRKIRLRIEQSGKQTFKAVLAQAANEIDFSDILPMG
jgi:hypothetical protein